MDGKPTAFSAGTGKPGPLPRLRALEILKLPEEQGFLLRDPEGYSEEELVLSEPALFVAAHADGEHTLEDIREGFHRRYGRIPEPDQVEQLLRRLDTAGMLETGTFTELKERLQALFLAAPTRPAVHAGTSYPDSEHELLEAVDRFHREAGPPETEGPPPPGTLRGVVAPHIDLRVGGPLTARAYDLLRETPEIETIIVLGTSHACPRVAWIPLDKPYVTPLGEVPVDRELCAALTAAARPGPEDLFYHRREHSIEFQAVFLARLRREGRPIRMVPVLCGSLRSAILDEAGDPAGVEPPRRETDPFLETLAGILESRGPETVVLAGADLAHVGTRFGDAELSPHHLELLEKRDRETLQTVVRGDPGEFFQAVGAGGDPRRICGLSVIYTLLEVLPGARGQLLGYRQATDPSGTVSYASLGLWS